MPLIKVNDLVKEYTVIKKGKGLKGALKSLLHKEKEILRAVNHISFSIQHGEIVGYIGPNGAGKSTTVKKRNVVSEVLRKPSGITENTA